MKLFKIFVNDKLLIHGVRDSSLLFKSDKVPFTSSWTCPISSWQGVQARIQAFSPSTLNHIERPWKKTALELHLLPNCKCWQSHHQYHTNYWPFFVILSIHNEIYWIIITTDYESTAKGFLLTSIKSQKFTVW